MSAAVPRALPARELLEDMAGGLFFPSSEPGLTEHLKSENPKNQC